MRMPLITLFKTVLINLLSPVPVTQTLQLFRERIYLSSRYFQLLMI